MLICIDCKTPLMEAPLYNDGKDDEFIPSLLFCNNDACDRVGLFTAVFNNDEDDKKDSDKGTEQEPIPSA